jgi:BirA family biotin operon repressor/biotin-[acetyl-CoA-carboxylase] ligase
VGLAVATALDPAGTQLGLKWPNDLWRLDAPGQGRKLGGILIEGMQVTDQRMAVIGIGLNILPLTMPEQVASLSEFLPGLDAPQVLARVMPELARVLARFEREGFGGLAQPMPHAICCAATGDHHRPRLPPGRGRGRGRGRRPAGAARRALHRIVSGEVSVRPCPPPLRCCVRC